MRTATWTAAAVLLADQASKFAVVHALQLDQRLRLDVLPPWFSLRMAWNQGINFGLFAGAADVTRWLLVALATGISVWVWLWVRREPHRPRIQVAAGLLIGGALGNVVDRVLYGAVADFLNMGFPGFDNPYSFNIADTAIFAGAVGLALFTGREKTP